MKWCTPLLVLCAACPRGKPPVPILNYHSVGGQDERPSPHDGVMQAVELAVSDAAFAQQLDWLAASGIRTLPLHDGLARQERAIVLTFDDGKEDALTHVLPALQKRGMRAAFFIPTSLIGTPGFLTWDGVRALAAAGMEIGSHGATHGRLADLPDERVREELLQSKRKLEAELHAPVDLLAYPFNSVRRRVRAAAEEAGYRIAVSGAVHGGSDRLNLLRTTITGATTMDQFRQIVESH
jgi:peptidoglycan/xylan/chitin deacetylase (PgdA/CDA1 family)